MTEVKKMEKESTGEMTLSQFREQLNEWFEERGIVDNLRSHLRSLMIMALQRTEINLKSHQKTCPKIQSIDLMVAEYLLKHGCHYTLSILTSELPSLANFDTGPVFIRNAKQKPKSDHRFKESEVIEILNCLRLSCDNPRYVWSRYNEKKGEESLLECLLRLLASLRFDEISKGEESEEEHCRKWARDLVEREKRIREYLKNHEEELLMQLKIAEKDLDDRRESIEKELTERQMDLRRIAFHWKDKHNEIMSLSKIFAAVKNENKSLREKLDAAEEEKKKLKREIEIKTEALERIQEENLKFKTKMQEYLKWKNKCFEVESQPNLVFPKASFSKGNEKYSPGISDDTIGANLNAEENSSSSEILSSTEDALLERIKVRVRILEEETGGIIEKYLKSKKKYEDDLSFESEIIDVSENLRSEISNIPKEMNSNEPEQFPKKESNQNFVKMDNCLFELESCNKKKPITEKEEEKSMPNKRREQNREYYLKSRDLLKILEKNTEIDGYPSVSSSETSSLNNSCSSESLIIKIGEDVDDVKSVKESKNLECFFREDINDLERLNLLKEVTYPNQNVVNGTREIEVLLDASNEKGIVGQN